MYTVADILLLRRQIGAAQRRQKQLRRAHRLQKIVAGGPQKAVLGQVGGFRCFLGLAQRRLKCLPVPDFAGQFLIGPCQRPCPLRDAGFQRVFGLL